MIVDGCNWIEHDYSTRTIKCLRCGKKQVLDKPISYGVIPPDASKFIFKHKKCKGVFDFYEN